MKKPVDFEKEKKRRAHRKKAGRLLLVLLLAGLCALGYAYRYEIASQGFGVLVSDAVSSLTKENAYPVSLSDEPTALVAVGHRAAVSAGGTVTVYNPAGEEKASVRLGAQNTLAASAGNYLLVYARGGYDLRVLSGETELFRLQTEDAIETAAVCESGVLAVVTADGPKSTVTVYSRRYNKVFSWSTSAFSVTALCLDDAGTRLSVAGVTSHAGEITGVVRQFSVASGETLLEKELSEELPLAVRERRGGDLAVVTDRAVHAFGESERTCEYDAEPIAYALFADGSFAVATGDYLTAHEVRITRTDANLQKTVSGTLSDAVRGLLPYGDELLVFTGERVLRCSSSLQRTAAYDTVGALQAAVCGKKLYYTTVEALCRLSLS